VSLSVELRSDATIRVDQERLRQAVVNVVDNACQAMCERMPESLENRLHVSTRLIDGQTEIRIADTGPGISPEIRDKIFEPLVSGRSFGVGLRLPLVKEVLEEHDGSVEVDDGANGGALVVLRLPADGCVD
jgi:signal transduction histidine kinase